MRHKSSVLLNGLRDYGASGQIGLEETPEMWCARLVAVFREVRRVLRDDGVMFVEIGDSYNQNHPPRKEASKSSDFRPYDGRSTTHVNHPTKPKDLLGQPWMLAFALRADGWYLRAEIIWHKLNCLSGGTWLYARTQRGETPQMLKDLVRLDPATVELWNGAKWTRVLSWTPSVRQVQLELELRNGERIGCTPEHLWPTSRGLLRADELSVGDVIDTCRLPEPEQPTTFMDDAQIGYLVGLYLAEGSMSGAMVQLASHANEVGDRQSQLAPLVKALHGSSSVWRSNQGNAATLNLNGPLCAAAIRAYVGGDNAHSKHLLPRAWSRSNDFLRAVMSGYLEGDGHWDEANGRWRLGFCKNDGLARDLRTLAARLGWSLRLRRAPFGWKGSLRYDTDRRKSPDTQIIAIRRSRARKFWDVSVEDAPNTFSLASGTLTHNCMPESVDDRPTRSHSTVFMLSKNAQYFYDADAVRTPHQHDGRKNTHVQQGDNSIQHRDGERWPGTGANLRTVWSLATESSPFAHFAAYPQRLVRPMVLAGSSEKGCCQECGAPWKRDVEIGDLVGEDRGGNYSSSPDDADAAGANRFAMKDGEFRPGMSYERKMLGWLPTCDHEAEPVPCVVLDPFAGSGTTMLVARSLGRHSIGIELNPEYVKLIANRTQQLSLLT